MKKIFQILPNGERGYIGLLEKDAPKEFEPLGAMGSAHDCLEHFPGDDGSIDREFMALGCMAWIRGEAGYFNGPFEKDIATEMSMMLWKLYLDGLPMLPPKSNRLPIDEWVTISTSIAKEQIRLEWEDEPIDKIKLNTFFASAEYWLQAGFNKAIKRYPNKYRACDLFRDIEEKLESCLRYGEVYDTVIVQYKLSDTQANVEIVDTHYDYDMY